MAKKARTPPPPRRVQAPKARTGEPRGERRSWLLVGGAAIVLLAAAALAIVLAFGRSDQSARDVLRDAGCTLQTFPAQGANHVAQLPKGFKYNSFPPTSGPHHPNPAPFDLYEQPVDQIFLVHNLEHGGVVIQYGGDIPRSEVDRMVTWYRNEPNGLVIAPQPALGDRIALTAWRAEGDERGSVTEQRGVLARCPRFDEDAFDAFLDEYGFRGPEPFTREMLAPGTA